MPTPARRAAFAILLRVETQSSYASELLHGPLTAELSPQDAALATETTAKEIRNLCKAKLAHYKYPKWIKFVEQLPKTATGKVQKYVLRGGRAAIAKQ